VGLGGGRVWGGQNLAFPNIHIILTVLQRKGGLREKRTFPIDCPRDSSLGETGRASEKKKESRPLSAEGDYYYDSGGKLKHLRN